ncbi:MAG: LPS assembly protein LptD [Phaeovulum sp.]|uniref:LPS-assembly protein LptD n=1 Tax=Phaeovulum sp. TaxID=2934796 RepID=UPI002730A1F8|nr:LPS assembly protein LptD [Phaeovulum sp.]MDP2063292.1 LPS assembly protein LptD [Phaeovulum sp.]
MAAARPGRGGTAAARALLLSLALALALAPVSAPQAEAQSTAATAATLLADRIHMANSSVLIAEGSVEVFYNGARLSASRIAYDAATDRLLIEGPLRLTAPGATEAVILADSGDLAADLRDGVLRGARMVLAQELQLAANTIRRSDGRYTTLEEVVASSCQICVLNPTPLWEIRARRVTHDSVEREIVYEGAQFRAFGVPLAYIPRLRAPDPGVERRSGLLQPRLRTTSALGTGIKLPYFWTLGDARDLTLTPYISAERTTTLELRYRQAFPMGQMQIDAAVSRDDILPGETRGYVFVDAGFALPRGFALDLDLRTVTDRGYLLDYGISGADRLWSGATLQRIRPDQMIWARLGNTNSLRDSESNATQPMLAGTFSWTEVLHPRLLGGELVVQAGLGGYRRPSEAAFDGPEDDDLVSDGRDALRATLAAEWRRNWLLPGGVQLSGVAALGADLHSVGDDAAYDSEILALRPAVAVELRWPWVRSRGTATEVIEPVAQLIWSRSDLPAAPNEDSVLVEFDEGNLFSLSRFPGEDAREAGLRANLGIGWTRHDAAGWSAGVLAGRVLRAEDFGQFGIGSGLSGVRSDWLLATHLQTPGGIGLTNRALFDDAFSFTRDELRLTMVRQKMTLEAGYIWMQPAPAEGRPLATKELQFDTGWTFDSGWRGSLGARYDFVAERAAEANLGLSFVNECVLVDLSLSRRFTSSTSVTPQTVIGLSLELAGFGGSSGGQRRSCMR